MLNMKKCQLISLNEKKLDKDSDHYRHRKLTLKVKFWHFLTLKVCQFPLSILILWQKLS